MIDMKKVCIALFFLIVFLLFLHPINAGDFFHHLNAGKYIAQYHALPYTDDLSFTAYGKPWVADAWGTDFVLFAVYQWAGPAGISILFALIGTITIGILYKTLRKLTVPWGSTIAASALAAAMMSLRFPSRPEVVGPLLISMLLYGFAAGVPAFLFPLLFLAWSIFYGPSAIAGLGLFAWYILADKKFSKRWIIAFTLSFIASLCNGYGFNSLLYIFQIPAMAPHVGEWLSILATMNLSIPDLVIAYQYIVASYILFTGVTVLSLIVAVLRYRKFVVHYFFATTLALGVALPFISVRFMSFAPLLVVPFLALLVTKMTPRSQKIAVAAAILLAILVVGVRLRQFSFGVGIQQDPFEPTMMIFLKTHHIRGNILSNQEIGAWLSWELPDAKMFVDTRDDLYQNTEVFPDLAAAANNQLAIADLTDRYHVDVIVFTPSLEPMYRPLLYSNRWKLVFLTDLYGVLIRSDKTTLPAIIHLDPYRDPPAKDGEEVAAINELKALLVTNPRSLENNMRLVQLYLATTQAREAEKILLTVAFPSTISPLNNAQRARVEARVAIAVDNCAKAATYLLEVRRWIAHPFLFAPTTPAPIDINEDLGDYEAQCSHNPEKAKEYFLRILTNTNNPIVAHRIERKMRALDNK
jgi:hypothetical protein